MVTLAAVLVLVSSGTAMALLVAPERAVRWASYGLEQAGMGLLDLSHTLSPEGVRTQVAYARVGSHLLVASAETDQADRLQAVVDQFGAALAVTDVSEPLSLQAVIDEEGSVAAVAAAPGQSVFSIVKTLRLGPSPAPLALELTLQPSRRR